MEVVGNAGSGFSFLRACRRSVWSTASFWFPFVPFFKGNEGMDQEDRRRSSMHLDWFQNVVGIQLERTAPQGRLEDVMHLAAVGHFFACLHNQS